VCLASEKQINAKLESMNKKINVDEDDFEWTETEFKHSVKINSLPKSLQSKIASRKVRDPQKTPIKVSTTIR
jgi:hypothetical protein